MRLTLKKEILQHGLHKFTFELDGKISAEDSRQRMKNTTSDRLKNLCIITKAWNFKKQLLQGRYIRSTKLTLVEISQ